MVKPKLTPWSQAKIIGRVASCLFAGIVLAFIIPSCIRARLATASNVCVNNLRQIESAKQLWALENNRHPNDLPPSAEIVACLKDKKLPACPKGGVYAIGRMDEDPKCSISTSTWPNDHVLNVTNSWWVNFTAAYRAALRPGPRSAVRGGPPQ